MIWVVDDKWFDMSMLVNLLLNNTYNNALPQVNLFIPNGIIVSKIALL